MPSGPLLNASIEKIRNVADAINAAESTLRAGRDAALRNPSLQIAHVPLPEMGRRSRLRSHHENAINTATSHAAPDPKNAPVWFARLANPHARSDIPATADREAMIGRQRPRDRESPS